MNTGFRNSHCTGLFQATLVAVVSLAPLASQAQNTFYGSGGLANSAANVPNVALGFGTLNISTGNYNTAIGPFALRFNTTGEYNTANGYQALLNNTTGYNNTAKGYAALLNNTTGHENTATGLAALFSNTTADSNTATGEQALFSNTTGSGSTASGVASLYSNTVGGRNTAFGYAALFNNATGSNNIAIGYLAGQLTRGNNNIDIGNGGISAAENGVTRIGTAGTHNATYIAGINGVTTQGGGVAVFIDSNGQLGTVTSSQRFKNDIKDMGTISERLMQLRPVTFRYKQAGNNGEHPVQYGLIAEEVAKVYPNLVQYDKAGKPFTIYYHLLTPMLLNELQKEHRQNQAQRTEITALKGALQTQATELALLKQSQQQQATTMAKLSALLDTSAGKAQLQRAVYTKR